ncbi:MAG TPA: hypothetical protein DHW82_03685 [Spirochaetia bacterium]|nr:MAG: hypothetical protein A2Y41_06840 [Spirochaetes bacterium GWB1_36_13]HCL56095.1 hypothetical protein [Spirochaetia bacterium]
MKSLKTLILSAVLLIAASQTHLFAEDWTDWEWNDYAIDFSLPNSLTVTEASDTRLVATDNRNFTMTVAPWEDETLTQKDVAYRGYQNYTAITNKKILDEGDMGEFNGFKGYYIYAYGKSSGKNLYFVIAGLINPNSAVNFYISYAWWDKAEQNSYFEQLAEDITLSFKVQSKTR